MQDNVTGIGILLEKFQTMDCNLIICPQALYTFICSSFIHSFHKHRHSTSYLPGIVLSAMDSERKDQ